MPSIRILVIDDERLVRESIAAVLEARGHEVIAAVNGRDGLEQVRRRQFDLVVTDLTMAGMTGIETTRAMRALPAPPRILAISGGGRNQADDQLAAATEIGAAASLAKPFTPAELLAAIERVMAEPAPPGSPPAGTPR